MRSKDGKSKSPMRTTKSPMRDGSKSPKPKNAAMMSLQKFTSNLKTVGQVSHKNLASRATLATLSRSTLNSDKKEIDQNKSIQY